MSFNGWLDQDNVVYICNGILFSLIKEGNPTIWGKMDAPGKFMLNEINQVQKDKYRMPPFIWGI